MTSAVKSSSLKIKNEVCMKIKVVLWAFIGAACCTTPVMSSRDDAASAERSLPLSERVPPEMYGMVARRPRSRRSRPIKSALPPAVAAASSCVVADVSGLLEDAENARKVAHGVVYNGDVMTIETLREMACEWQRKFEE